MEDLIEQLKGKCKDLSDRCRCDVLMKEKEEQKSEFEDELKKKTYEMHRLQQYINENAEEMKKEIEAYRKEVDETKQENDVLLTELSEINDIKLKKEELSNKDNVDLLSKVDILTLHETELTCEVSKAILQLEESKERQKVIDHENEELATKFELLEKECEEEKQSSKMVKIELEEKLKKIDDLEELLLRSNKLLRDNNVTFKEHVAEIEFKDTKLAEKTKLMEEVKKQNEEYKSELKNKTASLDSMIEEHGKELEKFTNRDKDNRIIVNKLSETVENMETQLHELKSESELLKVKHDVKLGKQQEIIKQLEYDLKQKCCDLISTDDNLNENLQKLEVVTKENENYKQLLENNKITIDKLQVKLDESSLKQDEIENECNNYQDKLNMSYETNKHEGVNIRNLRVKNDELELLIKRHEREVVKLKESFEKQKLENEKANSTCKEEIAKTQNKFDKSRSKWQKEIDELLHNFSELENELSFSQEELAAKSEELDEIKNELRETSARFLEKERRLVRDLESLNEQNETILQNEISKFKSESDEVALEIKEANAKETNKLRNEFQTKVMYLEKRYEETKASEINNITNDNKEKIVALSAERDWVNEKLKCLTIEIENGKVKVEQNLVAKETELASKSRTINRLGKRIETQQKLIDYVMKSLEHERHKEKNSKGEIMNMLYDITTQFNHKFDNLQNDGIHNRYPSPYSSIYSNTENSEITFSPPSSPITTPMANLIAQEEFIPFRASSPERQKNITMPMTNHGPDNIRNYFNTVEHSRLSRSMPESYSQDLGYVSPGLTFSTHSVYFAEQLASISKTFNELESRSKDNPQNHELELEIWKQRIHYRLKLIEDNMSEIETASISSSISSKASSIVSNTDNKEEYRGVTFHPSSAEIQELIGDVNKRYRNLTNPSNRYVNTE